MQPDVVIIALEYLEPGFDQTIKCLQQFKVPVVWAKRDGVGNLSRAFNEAFLYKVKKHPGFSALPKYVWFTTNITCGKHVLPELVNIMDNSGYAAICPAYNSDHPHIRPDGTGMVKEVPYIEFTAPIFRSDVFEKYYLDEDMWYWYMDLDISIRMRNDGYKFGVHHGVRVEHNYLSKNNDHAISKIRLLMRSLMTERGQKKMAEKHGAAWRQSFGITYI